MVKFFQNIKKSNGKHIVYFLGKKIFSYGRHKFHPLYDCCDIPDVNEYLKKGCIFPHPVGIVISKNATISEGGIFYQNVTIGAKTFENAVFNPDEYPVIGKNVVIYAGAVVIGNVTIGDNVIIGANTVVTRDIPANTICYGSPLQCKKNTTTDKLTAAKKQLGL